MRILLKRLFGKKPKILTVDPGINTTKIIKERFPGDYKLRSVYQNFVNLLMEIRKISHKSDTTEVAQPTYVECIYELREYIDTVDDAQTRAMLTATVNNLSISIAEMITIMRLCQHQFTNPEQAILVEQMLLDFTERSGQQ